MPLMLTFIRIVERISVAVGRTASLLLLVLIATIFLNIILRYGFNLGMIELEEFQWHLNAVVAMACMACTYRDDGHVRVDILHASLSFRKKAWIELLGTLFLFLPFVVLVSSHSWSMFAYSWKLGEGSPMPSGLPARYIIKFIMFAGFVLFGLQGVAIALRSILVLMTDRVAYAIGHDLPTPREH